MDLFSNANDDKKYQPLAKKNEAANFIGLRGTGKNFARRARQDDCRRSDAVFNFFRGTRHRQDHACKNLQRIFYSFKRRDFFL